MDRTFRGLIGGVIGAIIMNLINLTFFYILKLTKIRFLDWSGIIMLGHRPNKNIEIIYSLIIHILWTGVLGVILAYLIPQISSQGYLLKGGLYAFLITFIFRSLVILYKVPIISNVSINTSIINTTTSFVWGIILALILAKFEQT